VALFDRHPAFGGGVRVRRVSSATGKRCGGEDEDKDGDKIACVVDDVIPFALISLRPYSYQSGLVASLSPARKIQSHCQKRFNITHNVVSTFRPSRKNSRDSDFITRGWEGEFRTKFQIGRLIASNRQAYRAAGHYSAGEYERPDRRRCHCGRVTAHAHPLLRKKCGNEINLGSVECIHYPARRLGHVAVQQYR
jgi:hypothetical protein